MDTLQQWTPTTILKVPTVLPFTPILKQPLNSGHPATPYNRQLSWSQLYVSNTLRPQFSGHSSTILARLSTIAAGVNNLTLNQRCYSQYQPLLSLPCQRIALKTQPNSQITHSTPTGNIPEAPELLTVRDKMLVPNGVCYRGVPLYCLHYSQILKYSLALETNGHYTHWCQLAYTVQFVSLRFQTSKIVSMSFMLLDDLRYFSGCILGWTMTWQVATARREMRPPTTSTLLKIPCRCAITKHCGGNICF